MSDIPLASCPSGETCYLSSEFTELKKEVERLSNLVSSDPLTGLHNYRHLSLALEQEIERSQRTLNHTTLIMLDVDHFKKVNDDWGHETGNHALKLIAHCIISTIRKLDIACRYGGEEFAVILPGTDIVTGYHVAERIRHAIEDTPLSVDTPSGHQFLHLTASFGLSMYTSNMDQGPNYLVELADQQLYKAKTQGRNQTCFDAPDNTGQQVSQGEKSALFTIFQTEDK